MTKRTKTTLWVVLAVVVIGGLIALTIFNNKDKKKGLAVEFEKAATRTLEERVSASGRIFPVTEVAISSDVSGEVVELVVAEGDSVKMGQLLAKVDADAYESQVTQGIAAVNAAKAQASNADALIKQQQANRKQLEATLANAQLALKRASEAASEGLISTANLEAAQVTVKTAEANIDAADAQIEAAKASAKAADFQAKSSSANLAVLQTNLRRTKILAPMTGVVSLLNVEQGERVVGTIQMTGTEMLRIADLSKMEVQVEVSENDIPRVNLGDKVDVEVDAYIDRTFDGNVTEISNSANNLVSATGAQSLTSDQVTNFVVTISIDPNSYKDLVTAKRPYPFRPGMSAAVEILTAVEQDALTVPIAAVTAREKEAEDDGDETLDELEELVWVIPAGQDTVERRVVVTGIQDRKFIQVLKGLSSGEQIVVGPYSAVSRKLDEGDQVHEAEEDDDDDKEDDDD